MTWTHGDEPETHPLWEQQVTLERGMMQAGADRFRDAVIEAERRGNMTKLRPVRGLLEDWLPEIAGALKGWLKDVELAKGGPKPLAYGYLKEADPFVASLVALRAVLDGIGKDRANGMTGLAVEIGRTLEHELRVRLWEKQDPELFRKYERQAFLEQSTATHIRRVNINRFNNLLKDPESGIEWNPWSETAMFRVGVALLDVIVRKTGWFEIRPDYTAPFRKGKSPPYVFAPKPGMMEWMGKAFDHAELTSPVYKPTIMPPKRWDGSRGGGYWTPYVKPPRLIRFKASQEHQREAAADEYDAIDMPRVYEAVHMLQDTRWAINRPVFEVALRVYNEDLQIGGMPRMSEEELPARTPRMADHMDRVRAAKEAGLMKMPEPDKETDEEIAAWKKKAIPIYRRNAKRLSHCRSAKSIITVAHEFKDYEAFYFPHMMDFRGRIYPIPAFLQPQGNDLARGLLTFADAVPVTEENGGAGWLALAVATNWGFDKASFDERIAWVQEREDLWRRIATDPLEHREWSVTEGPDKVDKPWQALAAILEWVAYLDHGDGFLSSLPVMVDGTCNGIQHLAAMTKDPVMGALVNLTPAARPADVYQHVADILQARLEEIIRKGEADAEIAAWWLHIAGGKLPRSMTKRQVMVLPYGGSRNSYFEYTREWLAKNYPAALEEDKEVRVARITFLVKHLWEVVNAVAAEPMRVMKWLQDCAKSVAEADQPIYWVTPAGFVVRHFYGKVKEVDVKLKLDGTTMVLKWHERTKELAVKEQLQGISPNFIHSLDAACLQECAARCKDIGIEDMAAIHDAYGTHAGNMWALFKTLRESFVAVHAVDNLEAFRNACANVLAPILREKRGVDEWDAPAMAEGMLPAPLHQGDLEVSAVLDSDYFFA